MQHEGRDQVEAQFHAQRPGLRHQQALVQRHVAVRETAGKGQRAVFDAEEHQPVLSQDQQVRQRQVHGCGQRQAVIDAPERRLAGAGISQQRQCGHHQVDGIQTQRAVGVEPARRALVVVGGGKHVGNQETRDHVEKLHRQASAHQPVGGGAAQVVQYDRQRQQGSQHAHRRVSGNCCRRPRLLPARREASIDSARPGGPPPCGIRCNPSGARFSAPGAMCCFGIRLSG
ncbi:hypothetical protein LMG26696_03129 [Achromobacter pulmonis]|nr:hypothetical protein LMG26696_03129 [Achromobacter pulmonis]